MSFLSQISNFNIYICYNYISLFFTKVANNVIAKDEQPSRSLLWCKGREDKHGDIKPEAKMIADQLVCVILFYVTFTSILYVI